MVKNGWISEENSAVSDRPWGAHEYDKVFRFHAPTAPTTQLTPGIMSMKNPNDHIGNRTRDFPACSKVPQPTTPPRIPYDSGKTVQFRNTDLLPFRSCYFRTNNSSVLGRRPRKRNLYKQV